MCQIIYKFRSMIRKSIFVFLLADMLFACNDGKTLMQRYQKQGYQTFEEYGVALKCPCRFEEDTVYKTLTQPSTGSTSQFMSCETETERFELVLSDNRQDDFTSDELNFELKQLYNSENRVWREVNAAGLRGISVIYTTSVHCIHLNDDRSGLMLTVISPNPSERLSGIIKGIRTY